MFKTLKLVRGKRPRMPVEWFIASILEIDVDAPAPVVAEARAILRMVWQDFDAIARWQVEDVLRDPYRLYDERDRDRAAYWLEVLEVLNADEAGRWESS